MNTQYPLKYPPGWQRTQNPKRSKFTAKSPLDEMKFVVNELKLMRATNIIISSDMQIRADGMPYARQSVGDTGVAVYFTLNGNEQCIPCDKWISLGENIRAIGKTIEALRGIERWGAKEMMEAAFTGFKALPQSIVTAPPHRDWWVVLGVDQYANVLDVKAAYRDALKLHHPDAGGSEIEFKEVQQAYEEWKAA